MNQLRNLLLDTSSRLFADAAEPEIQDAVDEGTFPTAIWNEIEDNGLPTAALPEEAGGAGLTWPDVLAILRLGGAFALPVPLADTFLGQQVLHQAGQEPAEGPLALGMGTARSPLELTDSGIVGSTRVLWPGVAQAVLLAQGPAGDALVLLDAAATGEASTRGVNAAGEPVAQLHLDGVEPTAELPLGTWRHTLELAALTRATMIAGAMDRILDLTLEHIQGRVQFGRPISRFQAVQQRAAEMTGQVALAGVSAGAAGLAYGTDPRTAAFECASAKAVASELVRPVARSTHQLHAAIGFTREHVLQRFSRRLWTWRDDFGDESFWQEQVGDQALDAGGDGVWPLLCRV